MEISKLVRRLNDNEISQYEDKGYIKGLPVFSQGGVKDLQNTKVDTNKDEDKDNDNDKDTDKDKDTYKDKDK